ncbi:hypothetical protein AgCh_036143 [Apium graveolens]
MVAAVFSDDGKFWLEATAGFRKLLSIEHNSPIDQVIKTGVVPRFVDFLGRDEYPELQFEAAWILNNIASGTSEQTNVVIDHGAIPIFVRLLTSASDDVRETAVWALGNVAGDSPKCRDIVLAHGALMPLLAQFNQHAKISMLRIATWTLSKFCRGMPQPHFEQIKPALPALAKLLNSNDEEVLTNACWAFSYLSDGTNDKIQAVIDSGLCGRLVELLYHPSPAVFRPVLLTVGNITTGDDTQTQGGYYTSPLVQLLGNAGFEIKKEAAWAVSNAIFGGTHEQIKFLVSQGCIKPLCDLLNCPDPRIVTVALEGLEKNLKVGEAEKNLSKQSAINTNNQTTLMSMSILAMEHRPGSAEVSKELCLTILL